VAHFSMKITLSSGSLLAENQQNKIAALVISFLLSNQSLAWGPIGHHIVAERAEAKLTPSAHRAVNDLLSEEPEPILADVANWADDAKNKQTAPLHFINFPLIDCHYTSERDCPDGKCIIAAIEKYKEKLL